MSFTWKRRVGALMEIVRGGKHDGNILRVADDSDFANEDRDFEMNSKKYLAGLAISDGVPDSKLTKKEMKSLEKALENEVRPKEFKVRKFYDAVVARYDTEKNQSLKLPSGSYFELFPMLEKNQMQSILVFGSKESGKTWFTASTARNWHDVFPKLPIYLYSRKHEDEVLDVIFNLKRIPIHKEEWEEQDTLTVEMLA
jgi:hypothetical protein